MIFLAADRFQSMPVSEALTIQVIPPTAPLGLLYSRYHWASVWGFTESCKTAVGHWAHCLCFQIEFEKLPAVSCLCLLAMWIEEAKKQQ